jgi:hypothetical protein
MEAGEIEQRARHVGSLKNTTGFQAGRKHHGKVTATHVQAFYCDHQSNADEPWELSLAARAGHGCAGAYA